MSVCLCLAKEPLNGYGSPFSKVFYSSKGFLGDGTHSLFKEIASEKNLLPKKLFSFETKIEINDSIPTYLQCLQTPLRAKPC